jgi:CubicO group peptidase (beta-lactamase class C family)
MIKQLAFIFILLTTGLALKSQSKVAQLDKLMQTYHAYGRFNGVVLVAEEGRIIYNKGLGLANMEWNLPNTPATKFRIGSVTKPFTAMLIMQLVEQGKITLEAPVSTYIKDYPNKNGDRITIHHLLTHTSGIPDYANFTVYERICRTAFTPGDFIKIFADSALEFTPGEKFSYTNSGYFLLGMVIEKVTDKSYEQVLQEKILTPLNMINTGYDHSETILKNRASGYEKKDKKRINAPYLDMSIPFAAGAMYSTAEDLFRWDQAIYTQQLLKKETADLVFTKYISAFNLFHYGYGWLIGKQPVGNTKDSISTIFHTGDINGFTSLFMRIPAQKKLIVLINNTGGAPLFEITAAINGILYGKTYDMPEKSKKIIYISFDSSRGFPFINLSPA